MSVKIWCEKCQGNRYVTLISPGGYTYQDTELCSSCSGLSYIVKGCENCGKAQCEQQVELISTSRDWDDGEWERITFCTAWEKKDEG